MRLFEAITEANQRALKGDSNAGIHPADFVDELPVALLTCIDPRLNPLFPSVLGLPEAQFIWVRTGGNIVKGPLSSPARSLALACAINGAKEIAIIGHTDCLIAKTTALQLIERLRGLGIERHLLPENLNDCFGLFSSERQNVIKGVEFLRHSPLVGSKIPVHGLVVNIVTGGLEWVVNGYQVLETLAGRLQHANNSTGQTMDTLNSFADFNIGEMKFPETKIGETVVQAENRLTEKAQQLDKQDVQVVTKPSPDRTPQIPSPPIIRPKLHVRKDAK